ncbi:YhcN/YlaJ family sporulation lipoprotein [Aquibacillus rhizosphaerae]|uniref:YhcN/YlaJ family sporulation lipoprotein n=1 Tax=Aquibacillus rhizosphaerae TaxID=3051431 RepID=A0ABT7L733_9BACI|nr:YhcN/YlaJ family sporulation lipoprotein [Aquibacillus sp. LR5S19]MDL4841644.1 YhcN/YlaJ family sporulation lipoprotein [Aquibacillus sp. LR5S19]
MKKIILFLIISLACFCVLSGCLVKEGANRDKLGGDDDTYDDYPLAYNTKEEESERNGTNVNNNRNREEYLEGYQTDLDRPNNQSGYTENFYNDESAKVSQEVNKLKEVNLSQVIVTENKIIVSAMLEQNEYSDDIDAIIKKIGDSAANIFPNKEITVYTDAIYWNEMRNLNSRLKSTKDPHESNNHINDFINTHDNN